MAEITSNIWVILGPTASGKSELAFALAQSIGADILSADSMQVYRGMDIGTAKPSPLERAQVPHHLIDVADPTEEFTVARFVELADRILAAGKPIVITGGTPLYYKALFEGLFPGPPAHEELRRDLRARTGEELHCRLKKIDPRAAQRIHSNDSKRLIRALEVFELTGIPISEHQTEWTAGNRRYPARWFGLRWDKDALNHRINQRVKQMLANGWLEEVQNLTERYGQLSKTAAEATGYRQLLRYLRGEIPLDKATEQTKIDTRQLARRQMKWFRRFTEVHWLEGNQPSHQNLQLILKTSGAPPAR